MKILFNMQRWFFLVCFEIRKISPPLKSGFNAFIVIIFIHFFFTSCNLQSDNHLSDFSKPVIVLDIPKPTMDKPQSKLFFMDGSWFALLPKKSGPSLWIRSHTGWTEIREINDALKGLPGRADVLEDQGIVTAVGVGEKFLSIFTISQKQEINNSEWNSKLLTHLFPPKTADTFETATITKESNGIFWVAATAGMNVCVWCSGLNNNEWIGPQIIASGISNDDICTISAATNGICVIWTDQNNDAVKSRLHKINNPIDLWEEETTIAAGNKIADDHLNTAFTADSTLWVVSKNSIDIIGREQLVLFKHLNKGKWSTYKYAKSEENKLPSRPIIISIDKNPELILSGYTEYNNKNRKLGKIVFGRINLNKKSILENITDVIKPDTTICFGSNRINDVTGSKKPYPENAPWIILASDLNVNVYEADLIHFFNRH